MSKKHVVVNGSLDMIPDLGLRIRMVGRKDEFVRLTTCLHARGDRHFIYYWAHGGLGKTRLLEELQHLVKDAGPGYYSSGIIDLYHTDTHSTSDVERVIIDGLDPEEHYFPQYRAERARYVRLREWGADPGDMERRREQLSRIFVDECNLMAQEARKLVICFDTVELLQYESSIVEERAGLDAVDTRLKPWLLSKLSQMRNVLVVFAGRPKLPAPDEQTDPQSRLVRDFRAAFDPDLSIVELQPLTLAEVTEFVEAVPEGAKVLPEGYLRIVHRLTGGQPIFLHLVLDLLRVLSPQPTAVLRRLDHFSDLVEVADDDKRLVAAQRELRVEILSSIFNEARELGGYLGFLGLMPKGVDADILESALGLPRDEAEKLLAQLKPLSFVKQPAPRVSAVTSAHSQGDAKLEHTERSFLHDEMYALLKLPGVMPHVRISERNVANSLVSKYYDRRILDLEQSLKQTNLAEERIPLRERLQKLHVERMYYLLAQDPRQGYRTYHELTNMANRARQVGFSMRLLDEFLRFYNTPERRQQFAVSGVSHEQTIRESALLWLERFHWWAHYEQAIRFAEQILADFSAFEVRLQDLAIRGNIYALWTRDRAIRYGYERTTVAQAQPMLDELRSVEVLEPEELLARARLATSIGYMLDRGGLLALADPYYVEAKSAFVKSGQYSDELAMLLNNMAHLYASQGRITEARTLARDALRINEQLDNKYSTGLTLSTLANVAIREGNFRQALEHANEALEVFQGLEDAHGAVLALLAIGQAQRKMAKYEMQKGRQPKQEEARRQLLAAKNVLDRALSEASQAGLTGDLPRLHSKQGKVYRELGTITTKLEGPGKGREYYDLGEKAFIAALSLSGLSKLERADTLVDFAEGLFVSGSVRKAQERLQEFWEGLDQVCRTLKPGTHLPEDQVPSEYFRPLGKAERLYGQIALANEQYPRALERFATAYDYFYQFSPTASEKDAMVEWLYDQLHELPLDELQGLMIGLRIWVEQLPQHKELDKFVQTMNRLLAI